MDCAADMLSDRERFARASMEPADQPQAAAPVFCSPGWRRIRGAQQDQRQRDGYVGGRPLHVVAVPPAFAHPSAAAWSKLPHDRAARRGSAARWCADQASTSSRDAVKRGTRAVGAARLRRIAIDQAQQPGDGDVRFAAWASRCFQPRRCPARRDGITPHRTRPGLGGNSGLTAKTPRKSSPSSLFPIHAADRRNVPNQLVISMRTKREHTTGAAALKEGRHRSSSPVMSRSAHARRMTSDRGVRVFGVRSHVAAGRGDAAPGRLALRRRRADAAQRSLCAGGRAIRPVPGATAAPASPVTAITAAGKGDLTRAFPASVRQTVAPSVRSKSARTSASSPGA